MNKTNNDQHIIWDIETGPLPEEQLLPLAEQMTPFVPPEHPGEFDADAVKYGNLKNEEKRAAKLEDAKAAHAQAVAKHEETTKQAESDWKAGIVDKAALSATTGRVVAIGYLSGNKMILDICEDEAAILGRFWQQYGKAARGGRKLIGHNITGFDVPFIVRRSWVQGVDVPDGVFDRTGRYLNSNSFADTLTAWRCCGGYGDYIKLDTLARIFGVPGKLQGVDGGMFAGLLKSDPELAKAYLAQDLRATKAVAEKMGLVL